MFSSGTSACSFWQYGQVVSVKTVICAFVSPLAGNTTISPAGMALMVLAMEALSAFSVRLTG
ncbi:hypothetical protein D9M70_589700 [compost metagenome]